MRSNHRTPIAGKFIDVRCPDSNSDDCCNIPITLIGSVLTLRLGHYPLIDPPQGVLSAIACYQQLASGLLVIQPQKECPRLANDLFQVVSAM